MSSSWHLLAATHCWRWSLELCTARSHILRGIALTASIIRSFSSGRVWGRCLNTFSSGRVWGWCLNTFSSGRVWGRCLNTFSFRYPQRKKSQMLKSGDRAGQPTSLPQRDQNIHWIWSCVSCWNTTPPNLELCELMEPHIPPFGAVWAVGTTHSPIWSCVNCWNHTSPNLELCELLEPHIPQFGAVWADGTTHPPIWSCVNCWNHTSPNLELCELLEPHIPPFLFNNLFHSGLQTTACLRAERLGNCSIDALTSCTFPGVLMDLHVLRVLPDSSNCLTQERIVFPLGTALLRGVFSASRLLIGCFQNTRARESHDVFGSKPCWLLKWGHRQSRGRPCAPAYPHHPPLQTP
jgi:hypothetical protein